MSKGLAVIYDRASTDAQKDNWSRDDADRIGHQLAERYGYEAELRTEVKSGEQLDNRPVLMGILKEIEAGKVGAIIVQDFTRLSRDEDGIDGRVIRRLCRDNDALIITPQKVYDFSLDVDDDMADFEFLVGKIHKRQLIKAIVRGVEERVRQGEWPGGKVPLGYRLVPTGEVKNRRLVQRLEIDSEEAELVRLVFSLFQEMNPAAVAVTLNEMGHSKPAKDQKWIEKTGQTDRLWKREDVVAIVSKPIYAGWVLWGRNRSSRFTRDFEEHRTFRPDLQIIDQDTFDRCQALLQKQARGRRAKDGPYPFTGLLKCDGCGRHMVGERRTWQHPRTGEIFRYRNYSCFYRKPGSTGGRCPAPRSVSEPVAATAIIPFVAEVLNGMMSNLHSALEEAAQQMSEGGVRDTIMTEKRAELTETERQINNLAMAVAQGTILPEQARAVSQELAEKKARIERALEKLAQRVEIEREFREAISAIEGNVEAVLWRMFEEKPLSLAHLLSLIFKRASIVVRGEGSCQRNRHGVLVSWEFTEEFENLLQSVMITSVPMGAQLYNHWASLIFMLTQPWLMG
jgi:DNA invertase Pin-like site-specific DNA recombinase